ncbi:ankyrin repeat and SOCS box protein 2-like [Amphiprion ocellaris]|uniref:SOCS box domain-containing protein n=1 Tax=Amphiprion ocellaris TaxID=80972 RepID=A0A3Q1BSM8_AMPOC|nr:ankyrin repeat and SOCS box protein 2-like [Amphiprion ocellaris]XP_054871850.1 ankyrin repeat and SOCS box protein 2-like [Amphiprion ocellaris]
MAVSEQNLDDYSVYSQLSDEELLQIAVERSLIDKHSQPGHDQTSSPSFAPPAPEDATQTNPDPSRRYPDPSRRRNQVPPSQPPNRPPPAVQNSANPPTAMSRFLYQAFKREWSPIQTVIINGDAEALMDLVRRKSSSLTEPSDEGWIALHEAAYYGQLQCLRILVRAQPEFVNKYSSSNQTALLLAADRRHFSCVEFLLNHGANPNIANKYQETPLFAACEHPNEAIVELLLRSGAKVNCASTQGGTALHEACRHGEVKICRMLLDAKADLKTKNIFSIQPFFTAAQHGHPDVLRLLARRGADINAQAGDGASPLYEACKNGHVSAVEALLSLKVDTNRATKAGLLPLHVAVQNNHIRIVSMLIPVTSRRAIKCSGISPLHIAAEKNRDEIMELLIENGFDVNTELSEECSRMYEDRRTTALYFSVYNGNLEAAEMLLEAGANPNIDTFNPLLIAVRLGWMDMAELLLRYGANANAEISTQPSTFPSAILLNMECLPMLKLLLDNGCNARPCFDCPYGQKTHPPIPPSRRPAEELQFRENSAPQHCIQFCEAISMKSFHRISGPIISTLLDYVSHVRLCSRLLEVLESCSDGVPIKLKALPPHPLMQLCRLKIRHLVGVQQLKLLHTLPLPARLIRFLNYDVQCSLA